MNKNINAIDLHVGHVTIAANNGEIGGGEVMLLQLAKSLRALGIGVTIVAPQGPGDVAQAARDTGFDTVALPARGRRDWMLALRKWDAKQRRGLLWCNGLVPALATAGHPDRVVHVHQRVSGKRQILLAVARAGTLATVVPSNSMLENIPGAHVLPNWTSEPTPAERRQTSPDQFTVGFLGRLVPGKGLSVLADAMKLLERKQPGRYRLSVGGEPLFSSPDEQARVEKALATIAPITDRLGWVERADFFAGVDVLVVPSIVPESFGLVAAEAMAAQVPVIVSDAGGLPEVVGTRSGTIVPAGDSRILAESIVAVDRGDLDMTTSVHEQYERWQRSFSPAAGSARLNTFLTDLVATRTVGQRRRWVPVRSAA